MARNSPTKVAQSLGSLVEITLQKPGRAEDHRSHVGHFPSHLAHCGNVFGEFTGGVPEAVAIFGPFAVDMGANRLNRLLGCRIGNHGDQIHGRKGRQGLGAQGVVEKRPSGALLDEPPRCDRHHKKISLGFRFLKMKEVAGMNEVKGAVAMHNPFAETTHGRHAVAQLGKRNNFGRLAHSVAFSKRWPAIICRSSATCIS